MPPVTAKAEATRSVKCQSSEPTALNRCGTAAPRVRPLTRTPISNPLSPLAHVEAIFMPTGYRPAMQMPVTNLSTTTADEVGSNNRIAAFAPAATKAEAMKKYLG